MFDPTTPQTPEPGKTRPETPTAESPTAETPTAKRSKPTPQERLDHLRARAQRLESTIRQSERKAETRRKIIIGGSVLALWGDLSEEHLIGALLTLESQALNPKMMDALESKGRGWIASRAAARKAKVVA